MSSSALTGSGEEGARADTPDGREGEEGPAPGSNASTLSTNSHATERDSPNTSFSHEEHSGSEYEIVRNVMYSSRENINIVHEVFRQVRITVTRTLFDRITLKIISIIDVV